MFFSHRIRLAPLAQLCHRLAVSAKAGVDDRRTWRGEADRASGSMRRELGEVADGLAAGESIGDALRRTGEYFPPLFRRMVEVGHQTGRDELTYRRLGEHFDHMRAARRQLLALLSWPLLQLVAAVMVVGILIYVMGMVKQDILGFGLVGTRGLVVYLNILVAAAIALFLCLEAARRGAFWTKSLQRRATDLPLVGGALRTLAIARFTWALQLVLDTPMDQRVALPLALDASGNEWLARHGRDVADGIQRGMSLTQALAQTGALPGELMDAIAVGEEAGSLVETLERQSDEYQRRAGDAMAILAQVLGFIVWGLVAAVIIVLIFRIFSFYTDTIKSLAS